MKPPKSFHEMDLPEGWVCNFEHMIDKMHPVHTNSVMTSICNNAGVYWDYYLPDTGWVVFEPDGCESLTEVALLVETMIRMDL